ncbi:hypothetical protein KOI35_40805 [Actinoplanes bogorensis]|uniref:ATP-grasp domain-containing protein n=1 Tax=Paractinoplanes bogorensis TaxID=1610840 RepID=A0ABS5Z5Y1_9ACTN|nr:hypothetical protein [Actinoplanes bogorensis]MBU2669870.1 hypothetical protein [Actinoplanes bogorensis]
MILILTAPSDVHADAVERELKARGAAWLRFDPAEVPSKAQLSVGIRDNRLSRTLVRGPETTDLNAVTAIWFRRPGRPVAPAHLSGGTGKYTVDESRTFVSDVWETLDVPALPAPRPVVKRAQHKIRQLQLALEAGFEVPATVAGNDPGRVLDLFSHTGGRMIVKQVGLGYLGGGRLRYTEPVTHRDIVHADGVRHCPFIAQERIDKQVELRVTVVGDRVFTAAIESQRSNHARHDWRRADQANIRLTSWELPDDIAARCVDLVRRLGLSYGAFDLVVTPDGRYVFIEVNPSGQYLWVEEATGLPISAAVADWLMCGGIQ